MNVARTAIRTRNTNSTKQPPNQPKPSFDGFVTSMTRNNVFQNIANTSAFTPNSTNLKKNRVLESTSAGSKYISNSSSQRQNSKFKKNATPKSKYVMSDVTSSTSRGLFKNCVTPGSTTSINTMPESSTIVAITEGRGNAKGEVGMAVIDLRRPQLILCQISDTHSYIHSLTRLHYFNPTEIIVPHTFNFGFIKTELYKLIADQFVNVLITSVRRSCFSDKEGFDLIKQFCAPEYINVQLQLIHKFYALTAAGALLKYVELVRCITFASNSLKIEYYGSQNSTLIDVETAIRLELVESLSGISDRRCCLLSILNYTHTMGGLRNLRANILQPPCDEKVINARLDCVEELLKNNDGLMVSLKRIMRQFFDVDKILWLCVLPPVQDGNKTGETQLNHTLLLKTTLDTLPKLIEALELAKGDWFQKVKNDLLNPKFDEIQNHIKNVLHDDAHAARGAGSHLQRCFAVRPNINGLLDVARRSYSELINDIQDKVNQLADTYNLPLKLNSTNAKGFHIVLTIGAKNKNNFNINRLPSIFLEVQDHGSNLTMTTEEIMLLDQQTRESLTEIQTMSNIVISELLQDLRSYMSVFYMLCDHIADLDMILAIAQVSSGGNYCRPMFNEYLELKDSTHPILDSVLPSPPVPNDVFASPEYNFCIVTGPNMGGKSIYIKQIAILQIMAQIGCFIPATSAVFRLTDHIFSRIGFNDNIECNASSYVLEMKEIQYILQTLTPRSLIIVDELCRGTSTDEGTSMAWAICEKLLDTRAFTFFTTHFIYLTKLQDLYFNVVNLHTEAVKSNETNELIYNYKVIPGVTDIENYGLILAKTTNLPETLISIAEDLIGVISKHKKALPTSEHTSTDKIVLYKLMANLKQESRKLNSSSEKLNDIITKFKTDNKELTENVCKEFCHTDSILNTSNSICDISTKTQTPINSPRNERIITPRPIFGNISNHALAVNENSDHRFKTPEQSPFKINSSVIKPRKINFSNAKKNPAPFDIIPNDNMSYTSSSEIEKIYDKAQLCHCDENSDSLSYDPKTKTLELSNETVCPIHNDNNMSVISIAKRRSDMSDIDSDVDHLKLKRHLDIRLNNVKRILNTNFMTSPSASDASFINRNNPSSGYSYDMIVCEPDLPELRETCDSDTSEISLRNYYNFSDD